MSTPVFRKLHFMSLLMGLVPLFYELPKITTLVCLPALMLSAWNLWIRTIPVQSWIVQVLAPLSGVFFLTTFETLRSPESASSLMAFVICLKLFDIKTHLDLMIFLTMNLLLMMFYVLFSQTLLSTFLLFINYFFFVLFLIDLQKQKLRVHSDPFNVAQLVSLETLVALPLLIGLFLFFPRFTTSWGGLGAVTSQGVFGFSEKLHPGQMQNLVESEQIAFRILFENQVIPPPENLYFRGAILNTQQGWNWTYQQNSKGLFTKVISPDPFDYEILMEPRFEKTLFTLPSTNTISLIPTNSHFYQTREGVFYLRSPAQSKIKIQGHLQKQDTTDFTPPISTDLTTDLQPSPKLQKVLLDLKTKTDNEKLAELLKFFQTNGFEYSLNTPAYANIEDFLFGQKKGFCEHFASSFAVLARLSGLPSRVIVGFQGADVNPFGSYLIVKDKHAHAWNEVYLKDKGWTHIDVTSVIAPNRIFQGALLNRPGDGLFASHNQDFLSRMSLAWDALNNRFNLMLMNYNLESQSQLLETLKLKQWGLNSLFKVLVVGFFLFAFVFWFLFKRKSESVDLLAQGYLSLNQKLLELQIERLPHEGPLELRRKLEKAKGDIGDTLKLIDTYITLRYAANATPQESLVFYKDVKALKLSCAPPRSQI